MRKRETLLEIEHLTVTYETEEGVVHAVNDISLSLTKGKTLGIVGETGAGKTTTAMSILGLLPERTGRIRGGSIVYDGTDLLTCSASEMQQIRGSRISMIFQDPMSSLNPVIPVGDQIAEALELHQAREKTGKKGPGRTKRGHYSQEMMEQVDRILTMVGIPTERKQEYPHQFSGGMKQRVVIAMALVCEPELVIADEPTTALDVTIQAQVLEMMEGLKQEFHTSMILITHDLGVVMETCDEVAIMYAGEVIEYGTVEEIFDPRRYHHPYTVGLFQSIPRLNDKLERLKPISGLMPDPTCLPSGCRFHPRCYYCLDQCKEEKPAVWQEGGHTICCHRAGDERVAADERGELYNEGSPPIGGIDSGMPHGPAATFMDRGAPDCRAHAGLPMGQSYVEVRQLKKYFKTPKGLLHAVDGVDLSIGKGKTLGVVGESGCGKSTLGRVVLNLLPPTSGEVWVDGKNTGTLRGREQREMRLKSQMIFQDPYASLNPRMSLSEIIAEPMIANHLCSGKREIEERVEELMDTVGLARRFINSYPHELDGGRRQRIGVARALAVKPDFIVCDEPVSALDVSIQAQILNLLMDLQDSLFLTYLFITHDLSVVRHISDEIAVMYLGQCVELVSSEELFSDPLHPYTKALLSAIPIPDLALRGKKRQILKGEVRSPIEPKPGCRFAPRCPEATAECLEREYPLTEVRKGHKVACRKYGG